MTSKANDKLQVIFDATVRAEEKAESMFRRKTPDTPRIESSQPEPEEGHISTRPIKSEAFLDHLQRGPIRSKTS